MAKTTDHEIVSIYPFSDEQVDQMMHNSMECVLMWATKDSWPVGVTHAFVWEGDKIWITFGEHRHRTAAIKRNPKVSVNVAVRAITTARPPICPAAQSPLKAPASSTMTKKPSFGFIDCSLRS